MKAKDIELKVRTVLKRHGYFFVIFIFFSFLISFYSGYIFLALVLAQFMFIGGFYLKAGMYYGLFQTHGEDYVRKMLFWSLASLPLAIVVLPFLLGTPEYILTYSLLLRIFFLSIAPAYLWYTG
ncbi:hypothetical protein J4219_02135 [Candidatus Woesearchaeota archaeon]|nr:hypothetical protein [Candidatus Woesearchaeota archaeon]